MCWVGDLGVPVLFNPNQAPLYIRSRRSNQYVDGANDSSGLGKTALRL